MFSTRATATSTQASVDEPLAIEPGASSSEKNLGGRREVLDKCLTIVHLFVIGTFAAFLCYGQTGGAPINGDDIGVLTRNMLQLTHYNYDYLIWTQFRLHVVALLYGEYKLANNSLELANLLWLGVYVCSAFLGYAYLRKVFRPSVALTGAVFYLCYSSKYQPFTWWSAGAYTLVWLACFGLLYLLESKLSYKLKCVTAAAIVAASLYIYEVLAVLVPVVSLMLLSKHARECSKIRKSDWVMAALPVVVLIVHVAILGCTPKPIYDLNRAADAGNATITQRIGAGFTSAVDATLGKTHRKCVKTALMPYREYYQKESPILNILLLTGVGIFALVIVLGVRLNVTAESALSSINEATLFGAVALFVSAFIGFISNYCVTPSRLTGIPSIGLTILICAGIEWLYIFAKRTQKWKTVFFASVAVLASMLVLSVSVREVEGFHSLLKQAGEVDKFDRDLTRKIMALHPVAKKGEEIYVRMPCASNEVVGRWRNFFSAFNTGRAFETFCYMYDLPQGVLDFSCTPFKAPGEDSRMQYIVENWSKKGLKNVYPFFIDNHQKVMPITEIILTDLKGHELKKLNFADQFSDYKGDVAPPQRIPIFSLPDREFQK